MQIYTCSLIKQSYYINKLPCLLHASLMEFVLD